MGSCLSTLMSSMKPLAGGGNAPGAELNLAAMPLLCFLHCYLMMKNHGPVQSILAGHVGL